MAAYENRGRYKPGMDFGELKKAPLLDINLTDSTELWLIQWPLNQLKPGDFEGKELSLKLHKNKDLGTFESLSGKSYEVVSVGAKEPDATVFLPSESEATVVGKISRRVCLVRYPDPKELAKPRGLNTFAAKQEPKDTDYLGNAKPKYSTPTKSEASKMTRGGSQETQASAPKSGKGSTVSSHKKKRNSSSEGGSSHVTGMATTESANQTSDSNLERSIKKKKKKV
ncbi:mediator-associated protein 2 [Carex littledalei]|uniref:Mediator-associated protein 2 n=1 Tax=Carex littledalei TaxID=544730 RepID=A0A833QQ39_9POAL|nr:mediator-associated protein 2 [Carex littledalei]